MSEVYKPLSLYCDVGTTTATINIRGGELRDNAEGFVTNPCITCKKWIPEKLSEAEEEADLSPDRIERLRILLVDRARIRGGESKIVVAQCTLSGIL